MRSTASINGTGSGIAPKTQGPPEADKTGAAISSSVLNTSIASDEVIEDRQIMPTNDRLMRTAAFLATRARVAKGPGRLALAPKAEEKWHELIRRRLKLQACWALIAAE
ncbi:hypothetical protein D3C80_1652580 [compost metagenome]